MKSLSASNALTAASCIVAAMALLGLIDNLVILIAEDVGLWQFHLVRSLMSLPLILVVARIGGHSLAPMRFWAVALRSFLVSVAIMFYFGSIAFLTVAQAAAGLFTAPIFVLLITVVVLRRRVGPVNTVAAITGFLGILVVLRPDFSEVSPVTLLPFGAGVFYALGALATRGLCVGEGTLALLLYFFAMMLIWGAAGCIVLSTPVMDVPDGPDGFLLRGWVPITLGFLVLTAIQAVGSVIAVGLIINGYLLAEAAFVSVFEYSLLAFAAFWGYLLWGERLDLMGAAGIALIILSGAFLARAPQGDWKPHPSDG